MAGQNQDALFTLVKSMSPTEFGEFKKTLSNYSLKGRKNKFVFLLEAIRKVKEYDYTALADNTKDVIPNASLSSLKTQLKGKVLVFLRGQSSHHYIKWHNLLEDAQILCQRGLFKDAQVLIDKVKAEASSADRDYYTIAALRLEGLTLQHLHQKDLFRATVDLGEKVVKSAEAVLITAKIYKYYTSVVAVTLQGNMVRDATMLAHLHKQEREAKQFDTTLLSLDQYQLYLMAKFNTSRLLGDFAEMRKYADARLELYETNKAYFHKYQTHNVPIILMDHMDSYITHGAKNKWDMSLAKYKSHIEEFFQDVQFYEDFYVHQLHAYTIQHSDNPAERNSAVGSLERMYNSDKALNLLIKKKLEITLTWGHFKLHNYDSALDYCRKLTSENLSEEIAEDIEDFARFFTLIIWFEIVTNNKFSEDTLSGIKSIAESGYHYFRKKKTKDYRLELAFFSVFRRIGPTVDFVEQLSELRKHTAGWLAEKIPYIMNIDNSFDLLEWLDSHVKVLKQYRKGN